jgi:hypothetical protein
MCSTSRDQPWHKKVAEMIKGGCSPKQVASILKNTSIEEVEQSIMVYSQLTRWYEHCLFDNTVSFGHKSEPYMTEKEMLRTELPTYNYKTLSDEEKRIYNGEPWRN